ncbi:MULTISPECIES: hypothetical protein [unclassified Streptomyces]|uniref:hypothetical protein n=1 Tax=unclassified Streptomyces TaxID=2593676 RepID=UPI0036BD4F70
MQGTASASGTGAQACDVFTFYQAHAYGKPSYAARGPIVGKRNSSSHTSTLSFAVKTTKSRTTTWTGQAGGSIGWGIAKIEASTSYSVSKKVSSGVTVTNKMSVDAKKRGFTQPTALYRKFAIEKWKQNGNCSTTKLKTYYMKAIVAPIYFTECQTKGSSCTPKP